MAAVGTRRPAPDGTGTALDALAPIAGTPAGGTAPPSATVDFGDVASTGARLAATAYEATLGRVEDVLSTAGRHAVSNIAGLGLPGETWNVREAYRTRYNQEERIGGAVGDTGTIAAVAIMANAWRTSRFGVPKLGMVPPLVVRAGGMALLGLGAASGVRRTAQNVADDGHPGMVAATAAALGAAFVTRNVPGKVIGKLVTLGSAVGAGVAAHHVASRWGTGDGNLDERIRGGGAPTLEGKPIRGAARGFWNHFVEAGPLSQGSGFGNEWDQVGAMRRRYTDAELAGGMLGDGAGALMIGTGAVVVGGRILGRPEQGVLERTRLAQLSVDLSLPAQVVGKLKDVGTLAKVPQSAADEVVGQLRANPRWNERFLESLWRQFGGRVTEFDGRVPQLAYALGTGMLVYTLADAYATGEGGKNARIPGVESAAISGALVLGGAGAIAWKAPSVRRLAPALRPAVATILSAAAFGAISQLREPVGSYLDGADMLHERRDGARLGVPGAGLVAAGAVGGGMFGSCAAGAMSYRGPARVAAVGAGLALGAAAAWGLAPAIAPGGGSRGLGDLPAAADGTADTAAPRRRVAVQPDPGASRSIRQPEAGSPAAAAHSPHDPS